MKATGIVRKLDNEGRLTLPKSLREFLDVKKSDLIEIYTENNAIIIQKAKSNLPNNPI